ncbi:amidohydrolase [Sphingomicrobium sediminis]|uniref:Amidohydrolase n=1 Tax=Sphingomicrobium sediminis TaxID=2950949 RepID=A0A9X2EHA3_9SPHN|nr:amidohydrolase [Sphingomicrobium sediminis]MCM8557512.1 amidohydrolase [Sphingomicrobium sediminis]
MRERMIKIRLIAALLSATALPATAFADTLVHNVNGIQASKDGKIERFTAFVISDDGRIVAILQAGEAHPRTDYAIDMQGAVVMPGLIDAHGHVMGLGLAALQLDLTGTSSIAELQQRVKAYADANPGLRWIQGRGWNQEMFAEGRLPTAADIDAVVSDRPVWLGRVDGHAAVGNTLAMELAGVTAATEDPDGGSLIRDAAGNPTGVFIDTAEGYVTRVIPRTQPLLLDKALGEAQRFLLSEGITAVADMGTSNEDWHTMRRAGDAGRLQLRIMSYANSIETLTNVAGTGPTPWLYDGKLRMGGIKLYSDGALGSRGALLKQPYEDAPDTVGLPVTDELAIKNRASRAAIDNFQVAIHAIGDLANEQVIATFEELGDAYEGERRWRIEHVQILDPADLPRIAEAGIIASMQPVHQTSDWQMAEKRLGEERLGAAYAWNSIDQSGALLAFGSDFPVEHPNPFVGLKVAISREDANGNPQGGWIAEEKVDLGTALAAFTIGAAYAGFAEDQFGRLEPGLYADFIVIDRDPTAVSPTMLAETDVLETWIGGKRVYRAAD